MKGGRYVGSKGTDGNNRQMSLSPLCGKLTNMYMYIQVFYSPSVLECMYICR